MNCREALNALSFKWSSWNDASGTKQQAETIKQMIRLIRPTNFSPISWWDPKIHGMNYCEALNALSFKWSN